MSKIHHSAIVSPKAKLGENVAIGPYAVIYDDVEVGDNTTIHEFVTLHRGSNETKRTSIGSNVLMMAYSHVAHDCIVGNNCILANGVQIGGFGQVDDWAIIGGCTPIHQFCKVGKHCMVGGAFRVVKDVPPYVLAGEEPLRYAGLNSIGLRRRGFTPEQIENIKKAYHILYDSKLNVTQAKERIIAEMGEISEAKEIIDFLNRSKRGIIPKM